MRRPSAVSVRCAGGPAWHAVRVVAAALAAGSAGGWVAGQLWARADTLWPGAKAVAASAAPTAPTVALAVGLAVAALTAVLGWRPLRPRPLRLAWDGGGWRLADAAAADTAGDAAAGSAADDGPAGQLTVALDLGRWMLLRWQPEAGPVRWVAAAAGEAGPAWHALRLAAFGTAAHEPPRDEPRPPGTRHV